MPYPHGHGTADRPTGGGKWHYRCATCGKTLARLTLKPVEPKCPNGHGRTTLLKPGAR